MKRVLRRLIRGVWFWRHMAPVIVRHNTGELEVFRDSPAVLVRFWRLNGWLFGHGDGDIVTELAAEAENEWLNRQETAQRGF